MKVSGSNPSPAENVCMFSLCLQGFLLLDTPVSVLPLKTGMRANGVCHVRDWQTAFTLSI